MIYLVMAVAFSCVLATVQAFREQHLVVLRWPSGNFVLELGADGRYNIIQPVWMPMAVARFGVAKLAGMAASFRRAGARAAHLPIAAHSR